MDSKFFKLRKTYSDEVTSAAVGDNVQLTPRPGQVINYTLVTNGTIEYLVGKLSAYVVTGMASALLALAVAVIWFRVPFRGSVALFLFVYIKTWGQGTHPFRDCSLPPRRG